MDHLLDRDLDEGCRVEGYGIGEVRGHGLGQLRHALTERGRGGDGICARRGQDRDGRDSLAIGADDEGEVLRAERDACDIGQLDARPIRIGAQDDTLELFGRLELAIGGERHSDALIADGWRAAECPRRDLKILAGDRRRHFGHAEIESGELGRIDPHAHCALGAELLNATDTGHALQFLDHIARGIVPQRFGVGIAALGLNVDQREEVGRGGLDVHTCLAHDLRQAWLGGLEAVLYIDLREFGIGARLERSGDRGGAGGICAALEIEQLLHARDFTLDQADDRIVHHLRRGTGVGCGNADRGWRDRGVALDRHARNRDDADQDDGDGDDPGEDRTINEETRHGLVLA